MAPLTAAQVRRIRRMRADGHTVAYTATTLGHCLMTVRRYAPGYVGKVPVAALREAFLASELTPSEVARRMGWRSGRCADASRVLRTLGLRPDINGRGLTSWRTVADAEVVGLLAEAIGVMPWEVLPDDEEMAA